MYLVYRFINAIKKCKYSPADKFKIFEDYYVKRGIRNILSKYQTATKRFNKCLDKYQQNNVNTVDAFNTLIETNCIGALHKFAIYHRYNIDQFVATKIVTNYCNEPLDDILKIFDSFFSRSLWLLKGDLISAMYAKIMKLHLTVTLAQIFSLAEFAKNNKIDTTHSACVDIIYPKSGIALSFDQFNKYLENGSECIMSDNSIDNEVKQVNIVFFEKYSQIYNFIISRSRVELLEFGEENPDFNALVCRYFMNKSNFTPSYIFKCIISSENFYLWQIIASKPAPNRTIGLNINIKENIFSHDNLFIEI